MRLLVILCLAALLFISLGNATDKKNDNDTLLKIKATTECASKLGIIKVVAYLNQLKNFSVPQDQDFKCLIACIMRKLGMLKEGKVDWERIGSMDSIMLTEGDATGDKITEWCKIEVPLIQKDECHQAYSVFICEIKYRSKILPLPTSVHH